MIQDPNRRFTQLELVENTGLDKTKINYTVYQLKKGKLVLVERKKSKQSRSGIEAGYYLNPERVHRVVGLLNRPKEEQ